MKPKTITLLTILLLFIIILFQNNDPTIVEFLFLGEITMPLFVLIISAIFLGWVVGWFTHLAYYKGKYKSRTAAGSDVVSQMSESSEETEKA